MDAQRSRNALEVSPLLPDILAADLDVVVSDSSASCI